MRINVTTPLNQLGYGIVGLNIVKALARAKHEPALFPLGRIEASSEDNQVLRDAAARAGIYDPEAPSLRIYHQFDLAHRVGTGLHAGMPIFELNEFTSVERHHLKQLDLVFAPSRWAAEVLNRKAVPYWQSIVRCPFAVDRDIFNEAVTPTPIFSGSTSAPDENPTVFLNVGKWELRKGHDVLRDAFAKAFNPRDNVILAMNCSNPFLTASQTAEWHRYYKSHPLSDRVMILDQRLPTQRHLAQLMAAADCGVFPSRAEGWNLDLAEMMAMGKQVIATDYAAHTEFCTPENSMLIEIDDTERANDGLWFKGQGSWARFGKAQTEQLVEHMRCVHRQKTQSGRLAPNLAGIKTFSEKFTWQRTAAIVAEALGS